MSEPKPVAVTFYKGAKSTPIVVSINEYKGTLRLDIREYYVDAAGDMKPSQKGVNIPLELVEDLLGSIAEAQQQFDAANAKAG